MANIACKFCSKEFGSEESMNQHIQAKHGGLGETKKSGGKRTKNYFVVIALIAAIALFSYTFYARSQKTGDYDEFAKCLTGKAIVVYGNDFCQYTAKQHEGVQSFEKLSEISGCVI
ncbi:hypothetical protein HYT26_02575 [Candidatus Pacearchaeota archaeon]|nr:hypothetical protein [Candidatus Pacearchaeota archaeon]